MELVPFDGVELDGGMVKGAFASGQGVLLVLFEIGLRAKESYVSFGCMVSLSANQSNSSKPISDGPFDPSNASDLNFVTQSC